MTLAGLIGLAKFGLYANLLTPTELGGYSFSLLLSAYGIYICGLGLYEGALGGFPLWYGKKLNLKVETARNQILGFLCISGISLCFLAVINFGMPSVFSLPNLSVFLIAILSASSTFFLVLLADIRSRLMIFQFGIFMLARAALSILLGGLLAISYGYTGILFSEILITLLLVIIIAFREIENIGIQVPDFLTLKPLFRIGIPLMLNGLVSNTALNIDRFFVVAALGTDTFGQYSFAMLLALGGAMVQGIIYQQIGPEILHQIGQGLSPDMILAKLNRFIFVIFIFSLLVFYPFLLTAQRSVPQYFPEYSQTIPILPIVYFGATFTAVSVYENFTVALKKTEYILVLNVFIIVIALFASVLAVKYNASILVFAAIYAVGRFLYFLSTMMMAFWAVRRINQVKRV